ncbi:DUF3634 family protein [Shewanella sp. WXL01]|uniref:DUF3634 family protein n=1 Tax=Shewanella sp. WXL01 TaxID=2709721 RepID=UPI0014383541|nr:DUF3634 family protein [Shewanella sp. WXL01]NKF49825.1 DUF3634 family protein [Shewanella sp. WXL01]
MLDTIIKITFLAAAAFLAYKLIFAGKKGLTLFEMHYKDGRLDKHKGKIPEKFLRESRVIAKKHKLTCTIRADRLGDVRLNISANVGDNIAQQLRNVFPFEYFDRKQVDNSKLKG